MFESQLQIKKYFPTARKFLVICTRCDNKSEVVEDQILTPLACPRCDFVEEKKQEFPGQPVKQHIKIKLIPATIKMPDGVDLFCYLPVQEEPYGVIGE